MPTQNTQSQVDELKLKNEELCDTIDGLKSDLDDAVRVAVSRGALEWVMLNFPGHPALSEQCTDNGLSMDDLLRKVAELEREACLKAVASACAPVAGTPYIAGPRAFTEAIRALPDVSKTSLNQIEG